MTALVSRTSTLRDNILAAIKALPGWPDDVPVEKLAITADAFQRGHRTMVGVCLTDEQWLNLDQGLSDFVDHEAEVNVSLIVYSNSEGGGDSTTGVLEPDDGLIEGLIELILGSRKSGFVSTGLRSVDVGTGLTPCRLRAVKTQLMADQKRAEGSGGALAKVLLMRSTSIPL